MALDCWCSGCLAARLVVSLEGSSQAGTLPAAVSLYLTSMCSPSSAPLLLLVRRDWERLEWQQKVLEVRGDVGECCLLLWRPQAHCLRPGWSLSSLLIQPSTSKCTLRCPVSSYWQITRHSLIEMAQPSDLTFPLNPTGKSGITYFASENPSGASPGAVCEAGTGCGAVSSWEQFFPSQCPGKLLLSHGCPGIFLGSHMFRRREASPLALLCWPALPLGCWLGLPGLGCESLHSLRQ